MKGIIGRKLGMTQVFEANGHMVSVTAVEAGPCPVLALRTQEKDGYSAIQIGFDDKKSRRKHGKGERRKALERRGANRAEIGHARKAGTGPKRFVREVRVEPSSALGGGASYVVRIDSTVTSATGVAVQPDSVRFRVARAAGTHAARKPAARKARTACA